jgi:hypothetical protein
MTTGQPRRLLSWSPRHLAGGVALAAIIAAISVVQLFADQKDKDKQEDVKRASLVVKATPVVAFSPARIVVSAELRGGSDTDAELYCPELEWDWDDGTRSSATQDCEPFEAGKSTISRRFRGTHTYTTAGNYRLMLRLKRGNKSVVAGNAMVQIKPGVRDFSDIQ